MELNSDLIMQFGLMQKLSTGNSLLDALLVMLLPLLFSKVFPYLQELSADLLQKWQRTKSNKVRREITFVFKANRHFDYSEDVPPNHKLQTAILVHLNTLPDFQKKLAAADVKLVKAPKRKGSKPEDCHDDASSSSSSDSDFCHWYPDMELEDFEIKVVPPSEETIELEPGLTFCRSQKTATTGDGASKSDETTVTFTLESNDVSQIDDFISAAYESYRQMIKGDRDNKEEQQRFLYLPVLNGAEGSKEGDFTFRAYPLTDDKSFDNFFHPEKEEVLHLVEAFTNKTGKFAIKGYPNKLGFLLHGPPGTGKTTFLKALATHTKRSIINIPLSRIRTNQQLMSLMMDQQVRVEGDDYCRPLPHSQVIYVCEDVDAASHVVQKRGMLDPVAAALSSLMAPYAAAGATAGAGAGTGGGAGTAAAAGVGGGAVTAHTMGASSEVRNTADSSKATATGPLTDVTVGPKPQFQLPGALARGRMAADGSDELNLAGLLNVLDGVVDTPGRLLVLSTNHPEVLDPALIRPGRINRQLYMGHMATCEALQLIQHYFGTITDQQQQAFSVVWQDECVSPAALEALCAECEDVGSLLKAVSILISHTHVSQDDVMDDDVRERGCANDDAAAKDQDKDTEHISSSTHTSNSSSSPSAKSKGAGSSPSGVGGTDNQAEGLFNPEGSLVLTSTSDSLPSSGDSSTSEASSNSSSNVGDNSKDADSAGCDLKASKGDSGKEMSQVVMMQASSCFAELAKVFAAGDAPAAHTGTTS